MSIFCPRIDGGDVRRATAAQSAQMEARLTAHKAQVRGTRLANEEFEAQKAKLLAEM